MNRWRDTSQNINVYDKNQKNLYLKRITFLTQPQSWQANHITQNQRWATETALASPIPFFLPPQCPYRLSITQVKKIPSSSHSTRGMKKNQTVNSKVDFTINPKRGLTNIEKPNIYTQCSFSRKEQTHTLSERGFLMDYVHWLNENYCIWEGTYLWFKA